MTRMANSRSRILTAAGDYVGMLVVLGVLVAIFSLKAENFLTPTNLRTIANQIPAAVVIASGMTFVLIIAGIVLLMILYELGFNIVPILASAGLAGLVLSLGSQTFIRDFFGGVLILVENLFTVGDVIQVADNRGKVERITLRATYLRNLEGEIVIIPNGDIRTFRNLTTDWSRAVVTLNVPRDADMDRVMDALHAASQAVGADETVAPYLLEAPEAEGWIDLTDAAIQVRFTAKTAPGKQWQVAQALRKYALQELSEKNLPAEPE